MEENSLSKKEVAKDVVNIAWPVFVELLLSSLIGMVNMMMIGRIADATYSAAAVASVGLTNQPYFLVVSLVQAVNVGATAIISRYHGAKQYDRMENIIKHVLLLSVCCFILPLVTLSIIFAPNILVFLGAENYTLTIAITYFRLIMVSFLFSGITLTLSAALRGVGENKTPMRNNLIANGINVLLNFLLIYGYFGLPSFKLVGTGVATLMASIISCALMSTHLLLGKSKIKLDIKSKFQFSLDTLMQLIRLGIPSALEQLLFRMGAMTFTMIVSQLGTVVYAAHQIGLNMWTLSISPSQAFGIAASTLVGKHLGARKTDVAHQYVVVIRQMAFGVSIIMGLCFYFFAYQLAGSYSSSKAIIEQVLIFAPILSLIQPFLAEQIVISGALRGAGDTFWPMIATITGVFIIRTILAHYFVNVLNIGIIGAWFALLGNQVVSFAIVWIRFLSGKWKYVSIF